MQELRNVKEVIIHATTELIRESDGNITKITSRKIAGRAEVGLGLINYHFGSKENLITICVQRIINNVVMCFSPDKKNYDEKDSLTDKERLADWAKQVYDFLLIIMQFPVFPFLGICKIIRQKVIPYIRKRDFLWLSEMILEKKIKEYWRLCLHQLCKLPFCQVGRPRRF